MILRVINYLKVPLKTSESYHLHCRKKQKKPIKKSKVCKKFVNVINPESKKIRLIFWIAY